MSEPVYSDDWLTVHAGDCRDVLAQLPAGSVHTVVTSPPYYGLRDYGLPPTIWGGDPEHAHSFEREHQTKGQAGSESPKQLSNAGSRFEPTLSTSCDCGAWSGVLGLEPSVELYVEHLVEVFEAVRRVLRDDGTLWLNLGDSYAGSWGNYGGQNRGAGTQRELVVGSHVTHVAYDDASTRRRPPTAGRAYTARPLGGLSAAADRAAPRKNARELNRAESGALPYPTRSSSGGDGLKPKDLIGVPWRVAFALQAAGWWLRRDIIWDKPNPMPESVRDRPTSAHEYVFLFAKSERYYFDADAVREPHQSGENRTNWWGSGAFEDTTVDERQHNGREHVESSVVSPARSRLYSKPKGYVGHALGRNIRSVWRIATVAYPEAHFATFPPALPERCIKAGSSEHGACPECGAPWSRVVEIVGTVERRWSGAADPDVDDNWRQDNGRTTQNVTETRGWRPNCEHSAELVPVPCVVLDPFAGSGTVGLVGQSLSRRALLIDQNAEYIAQQLRRNQQTPLGLK